MLVIRLCGSSAKVRGMQCKGIGAVQRPAAGYSTRVVVPYIASRTDAGVRKACVLQIRQQQACLEQVGLVGIACAIVSCSPVLLVLSTFASLIGAGSTHINMHRMHGAL